MPTWAEISSLRPKALGTADTIQQMHRVVALGKLDPIVIKIAHSIRAKCDGGAKKNFDCQAGEVFNWLRQNMTFVRHPHQVQKIESPRAMIARVAELRSSGAYRGPA